MTNPSSPYGIQNPSVFMIVFESRPWPMVLLAVVLFAEAIILIARFPMVVRFFSDLSHGRRVRVQSLSCRNTAVVLLVIILCVGILAVFLYYDYANERRSLRSEPGLEEWKIELSLKVMFGEYLIAVAIPGIMGICGLGVWLYMYYHCLAKGTDT